MNNFVHEESQQTEAEDCDNCRQENLEGVGNVGRNTVRKLDCELTGLVQFAVDQCSTWSCILQKHYIFICEERMETKTKVEG